MIRHSVVGAVCLLALSATPSLAETSTTTVALSGQTPNPSVVGETVNLQVTVTQGDNLQNACAGAASITDTTGAPVAVCPSVAISGPAAGPATGTCNYAFPTAGVRTLTVAYAGSTGVNTSCAAAVDSVVNQTVSISVPTLTEWALWLLAGILLLGGTAVVARRTQRQSL